jgi:hypothetical protein
MFVAAELVIELVGGGAAQDRKRKIAVAAPHGFRLDLHSRNKRSDLLHSEMLKGSTEWTLGRSLASEEAANRKFNSAGCNARTMKAIRDVTSLHQ